MAPAPDLQAYTAAMAHSGYRIATATNDPVHKHTSPSGPYACRWTTVCVTGGRAQGLPRARLALCMRRFACRRLSAGTTRRMAHRCVVYSGAPATLCSWSVLGTKD
jgi:hypothetical protein